MLVSLALISHADAFGRISRTFFLKKFSLAGCGARWLISSLSCTLLGGIIERSLFRKLDRRLFTAAGGLP